jgi:hypothetical protein
VSAAVERLTMEEPVIDIEDAFVLHRGRTHDVAAFAA